ALGFSEELADLSRKLAAIWQTRLALAARKPELAAPLVTQTARSCLQFREFCQKLAEYVCIDRHGRVRPAHLGRKVLAGAAVGASLSLTLGSMGVQAADIHVNADVGDPGCDLIDAILSANANAA